MNLINKYKHIKKFIHNLQSASIRCLLQNHYGGVSYSGVVSFLPNILLKMLYLLIVGSMFGSYPIRCRTPNTFHRTVRATFTAYGSPRFYLSLFFTSFFLLRPAFQLNNFSQSLGSMLELYEYLFSGLIFHKVGGLSFSKLFPNFFNTFRMDFNLYFCAKVFIRLVL